MLTTLNRAKISFALVCLLFITITNQLLCKSYVKLQDKKVSILNPDEIDNALVEALLCGLYDIQQNYPNYVSVEVSKNGQQT